MRRVPTAGVPPAFADWLEARPEAAQAEGAAWERFRTEEGAIYRALLAALVQAQLGLCADCEQRLTRPDGTLIDLDRQVEHVLPQGGLDPHHAQDATRGPAPDAHPSSRGR